MCFTQLVFKLLMQICLLLSVIVCEFFLDIMLSLNLYQNKDNFSVKTNKYIHYQPNK